jgi:hypothetical protein
MWFPLSLPLWVGFCSCFYSWLISEPLGHMIGCFLTEGEWRGEIRYPRPLENQLISASEFQAVFLNGVQGVGSTPERDDNAESNQDQE